MVDLLGFAGSSLIVLSLTMKSIIRLRIVGIAGALVFVVYGLWIGALPVVATNTVTLSIHLVRLRSLFREGSDLADPGELANSGPTPRVAAP